MAAKIIVVGSSNTDMIIKSKHIPRPGETVLGGRFSTAQGGKGANQAVAAAKAGGAVLFIARVGNDLLGKAAIKSYQEAGINTAAVMIDAESPTGVALINVSETGENSIAVASGANLNLSTKDIEQFSSAFVSAKIVLMQLETPLETVVAGAKLAKANQSIVILNPAPALELPLELFKYIDIITPNETETELLTGLKIDSDEKIREAAKQLIQKGVGTAIITLGSRGVYHSSLGFIEGFRVKAMDTTAAGDVFNGALAVSLAEKGAITKEAVLFANAAAALSVQKMGAQDSIPTRTEIEEFLLRVKRD